MGEKDIVTKRFINNDIYFADICNSFLYNGRQTILPEQLHELDTQLFMYTEYDKLRTEHTDIKQAYPKERDAVKYISAKTDNTAAYLIVGIEHQSDIDYTMPMRTMLYDALQYDKQKQEIEAEHRTYKKNDKLLPVITIVLYFGSKPWDGPMSLHDMLQIDNPALLQYIADYPLHLIDPHRMNEPELERFQTNAREVLTFIKHSKNKKKVLELVQEERFKKLDSLAAEVINECTNSHLPLTITKEDVNMCQAIDEIREDSRNEGRSEGRIEGIEIGSINRSKEMAIALLKENVFTINKIAELTKLSIEEINQLVGDDVSASLELQNA